MFCSLFHLSFFFYFSNMYFPLVLFFVCHSLCYGQAARAYSLSCTQKGFLSSVKLLVFLPPLLSLLILRATRYADKRLWWGFFAVSWAILWFLIWLSTASDEGAPFSLKPDSHVSMWWEAQNAAKTDIFLSSFQTSKLQALLSYLATLLSYSLHWFLSFALPPLSLCLNNVYI